MAWLKVVERKGQSVLISSYFYNGIQTKYFKKTLGFDFGLDNYLIVDYVNYYKKDEVEKFVSAIEPFFKSSDYTFLRNLLDKLYKKAKEILDFSENIKKHDSEALNMNCYKYFKKFSELCLEFGPSMYLPILVEKLVEDKVQDIVNKHIHANKDKVFYLFTSSHKPTYGTFELINLYRIALLFRDGNFAVVKKQIEEHLKKFGWLSFTKFVGEPWTNKTIIERINELKDIDIRHELVELEHTYKHNEKETQELISENNIGITDKEIIWLAKELAYFRTYRLDVYTKAGFNVKPLFKVVAHKLSLSEQELTFLTYEEILNYLKLGKPADSNDINKRKEVVWQLKFSHGKMEFGYKQPFEMPLVEKIEVSEFRGRTAYAGHVTSRAKIIRGVLEFGKMEKGCILVTSMTTPDFVPLMEKSKAIITDEGGITCHAAIVARELKVPCIVGTTIATSVLNDDDLIEVDATKGTVKILKRSQ